jgi:hypothetical protein
MTTKEANHMSDTLTLGEWHVLWCDANAEVVDQNNDRVAVVHGPDDAESFRRALLVAAAPTLRDALVETLDAIYAMAQRSSDPDVRISTEQDLVPRLLAALAATGVEIVGASPSDDEPD